MNLRKGFSSAVAFTALFSLTNPSQAKGLEQIEHIVVIYLENRSFDSLFGFFPKAEGLNRAKKAPRQVDEYGRAYAVLPGVFRNKQLDERFPADLANQPFDIADFVKADQKHPDLSHRFFIHQMQINGGRNDRFAQLSIGGALTLGYYYLPELALWRYAREFTLADHFFQAAFGGSFLNHQWLICACTPEFKQAPSELRQWKNDPNSGKVLNDPTVTEDGFVVGALQPFHPPFDETKTDVRLPVQSHVTIGDRLTEKGITWAWYAGGWNDASNHRLTEEHFQYHHQPFLYYANYAPGSQGRSEHLKDQAQLFDDLRANFPQVAFIKPVASKNQHPGYASILDADEEVKGIVEAIRGSALWSHSLIIITYDEYGGFWDHVAPPAIDRWGPGTRIPAIIVSPFAKKAYVDHTTYDTTSILKLIEMRFGLAPLSDRDAQSNDLRHALTLE